MSREMAVIPKTGSSKTGSPTTGSAQTPLYPAYRIFGPALALAAANPLSWTASSGPEELFTLILAAFGLWAAAPVVARPLLASRHWYKVVSRHRNTVFAAACTLTAAVGHPPIWLMAADAALLLGYLLALDAVAAGPVGLRQLRLFWPGGIAAVGTALVLALIQVTQLTAAAGSGSANPLGRWLAGAGAALAGFALAGAFLPRSKARSR